MAHHPLVVITGKGLCHSSNTTAGKSNAVPITVLMQVTVSASISAIFFDNMVYAPHATMAPIISQLPKKLFNASLCTSAMNPTMITPITDNTIPLISLMLNRSFKNIAAIMAMKTGPKPWINAPEEADVYIIDRLKRI